MKTERAIELLNRISDSQFDGPHGDERREALSMAVRALEQNLVKESGDLVQDLVKDCISRQQAIDALNEVTIVHSITDFDAISAILDLPPIQPIRPKKGRWILVTNGRSGHECDKCHNYAPSYQSGGEHLSDFCPHCGADMRGEQDE